MEKIFKHQELGKRIEQARGTLTKKSLAIDLGVTWETLNNYENGKHMPKPDILNKISSITGVDYQWILNGGDQEMIRTQKSIANSRPWSVDVIECPVGAGSIGIEEVEIIGKIALNYHIRIDYAIKVRGISMEPEISEGALLLVQEIPPAVLHNDDIAICLIPDVNGMTEWKVRHVFFHTKKQGTDIILQSNNGQQDVYPNKSNCIQCLFKVIEIVNDEKEITSLLGKMQRIVGD